MTLHWGGSPGGQGGGKEGGASAQNKAPAKVNLDHISKFPQRSPAVPKHRVELGSSSADGIAGNVFQYCVPQCVPSNVRQVAEPRFWHGDSPGTSWTLKAADSTQAGMDRTPLSDLSAQESCLISGHRICLWHQSSQWQSLMLSYFGLLQAGGKKKKRRPLWEGGKEEARLSPVSGPVAHTSPTALRRV